MSNYSDTTVQYISSIDSVYAICDCLRFAVLLELVHPSGVVPYSAMHIVWLDSTTTERIHIHLP